MFQWVFQRLDHVLDIINVSMVKAWPLDFGEGGDFILKYPYTVKNKTKWTNVKV